MEIRSVISGTVAALRWGAESLLALVYPRLCEVCGDALVDGEDTLCLKCLCEMPLCRITDFRSNFIHDRLAGHTPIEKAVSLFYYLRSNRFTLLIQDAKYNGRPRIASWLARKLTDSIQASGFFADIDMIVPVPLHLLKKLRRGYNQTDYIAGAISGLTGIPVEHALVCRRRHSSQTRRTPFERWLNARDTYTVSPDAELTGKHILIVDDVITTGATLLSCAEALHAAFPSARISVLSLGVTELS